MNRLLEWKEISREWNNHDSLPKEPFRCLVIGESNSGKTCLLFQLLLKDNWLNYDNLILVGDSLHQEKYKILQYGLENGLNKAQIREIFNQQEEIHKHKVCKFKVIEGLGLQLKKKQIISCSFISSFDLVPDPNDLDANNKTVVVFDDVIHKKNQEITKAWFTRGRHANAIVFYLSQSNFALDRRMIRMNSNFLILFRLSKLDIQNLHKDRIAIDMDLQEFSTFCNEGWNKTDYSFIVIDFTQKPEFWKKI